MDYQLLVVWMHEYVHVHFCLVIHVAISAASLVRFVSLGQLNLCIFWSTY